MRHVLAFVVVACACGDVNKGGDTPDASCTKTWYADCDGDGVAGLGADKRFGCAAPLAPPACGGSWTETMPIAGASDCDDTSAEVHPGATEICDMLDNDCDGPIDEDGLSTFYQDYDGDGHGNPAMNMQACGKPAGYVTSNDDCNDNRVDVYAGHPELCDGVDNDCNLMVDDGAQMTFYRDADGDGHGNAAQTMAACNVPAGYVTSSDDCNDARADIYPGAAEVCDGADNNCNTTIDEGVKSTYYRDADGDGYGNAAQTTLACSVPAGYVTNATDCNDSAGTINPNAAEVCFNGADDNCSGAQDEVAECSIACNWSGARWLSHGWDGGNAFYAGVWASCLNGRLSYMDYVLFNPPGTNPAAIAVAMGTTDNVVGCNWGNAFRWTSQGYDGGNAFTYGMDAQCSGGRVTSLVWGNDQAPTAPIVTAGQLGCDWNGAIYLSHGIDGNCAWYTGMVVTCSNSHITNFQAVEAAGCARARD